MSFSSWRTVYTGKDNCWKEYRRDHQSSQMLAINKGNWELLDFWERWVELRTSEIAKSLKDANWDYMNDGLYSFNDNGAFGKEVGKRVVDNCTRINPADGSKFFSNIVIDKTTKKIQRINVDPTIKAVPNNCKEIDLIRCKRGYIPKIGEKLNSSMVISGWEIKNSITGTVDEATKTFYTSVLKKSRVLRVASGYRYKVENKSFQIVDEVRYLNKTKILQYALVLGATMELINASRIWLEDPAETEEYK